MKTIDKDKEIIRKLHEDVVECFNNFDIDKLLSFHTDNIILMDPDLPTIQGKKEVRELFTAFKNKHIVMKLNFDVLEMDVCGEMAFVRGLVVRTTFENDGVPVQYKGRFISILQKQPDGNWLRSHVIANGDVPFKKISSLS